MSKRNCVVALVLVVLVSACGGEVAEEPGAVRSVDSPAVRVADERTAPTPVECWCCTWKPGTSYPDGVPACARGETVTNVCDASPVAGAEWPEWAPSTVSCPIDDPWGSK